jgi:hypothetical protein
MKNPLKKFFKPKLKLVRGTRFVSFLFIAFSVIIAAGFLFAANMYYNIDTGEIVMEEIQRVTGTIRATASLIIGGTSSQNPAAGVTLEVATGTVSLSGANQVLRFTGGTSYYVGFQAPTTVTSTKTYILPQHGITPPSADYVLTYQAGDQLTWKSVTSTAGAGDITAVGDVTLGDAFTSGGTQGTSLWFYDAQGRGKLTIADLSATTTYTLPNLSGVVALQATTTLTAGGVLLADGAGLIVQDATNLFWATSTGRLGIKTNTPGYPLDVVGAIRSGRSGTAGQIIISNNGGYGLVFQPHASMAATTTYTWPTSTGTNNYVLTTDGSGGLTWQSVVGAGGVQKQGTPVAGQVSFFVDQNTIAGDTNFSWATTTGTLTISGAGGITSALYTSTATTTIGSGTGGIILDPASGKIILASGDWIETYQGYQIGKGGIQVLREMIPIFGFDLPTRCSTACQTATTVSRTIEDYPFSAAAAGTDRIHKFVIRYADSTTTASSTWTVWNETGATTTATFQVPASASTDLGKGEAYITPAVTIPTNTNDWSLRVQVSSGVTIQIYEIFLAAYDQIQ